MVSQGLVNISDGTFFASSLPKTAARLVAEWTELHRDELAANWQRAQSRSPSFPSNRSGSLSTA